MKFKSKLFLAFLVVMAVMATAAGLAIYEYTRISNSVNSILEDNYKSIVSTKLMLEALEREDSGILLILLDEIKEGSGLLMEGDSIFLKAINVAENNITVTNEEKYIADIWESYRAYRTSWDSILSGNPNSEKLSWYSNELFPAFSKTKTAVKELMYLNQNSMYHEASLLKESSKRAMMPGIVAMITSIIFFSLFVFFINIYFLSPLKKITRMVEEQRSSDIDLIDITNNTPELDQLLRAINALIQKIKSR